MTRTFLRILPFYSVPAVGEPDLEPLRPVALWRCPDCPCEGRWPDSPCDDGAGLHYTLAGDEATFWCPRHWYEIHLGPDACQRLVPMSDRLFRDEVAALADEGGSQPESL